MRKSKIAPPAAIAVALMILGAPTAQAAPNGTLQAPYESASSWHRCQGWSDEACRNDAEADNGGNLRVEASAVAGSYQSADAESFARVEATHQIDATAQSVTYSIRLHVSEAYANWHADPGCSWDECWAEAGAVLQLLVWAQHSSCGSCYGSNDGSVGAPADISRTLVVSNHAGGTVPAGTIRIYAGLHAVASVYTQQTSCALILAELCPPPASASAKGVGQLTSIAYEVEEPPMPNKEPTAAFSVSCAGRDCLFDARSSVDPDGQIAGYSWNFGDGSNAMTGPTVQHRYADSAGIYIVALTVTDDRGGTDGESRTVKCTKKNPNKPTTCS